MSETDFLPPARQFSPAFNGRRAIAQVAVLNSCGECFKENWAIDTRHRGNTWRVKGDALRFQRYATRMPAPPVKRRRVERTARVGPIWATL